MPRVLAFHRNSKASFAVTIMVALMVSNGIRLLIQASSMPLIGISAALINALLVRGWRDVMLLNDTQYPLMFFVPTAVYGMVFVVVGVLIGAILLRPDGSEPSSPPEPASSE